MDAILSGDRAAVEWFEGSATAFNNYCDECGTGPDLDHAKSLMGQALASVVKHFVARSREALEEGADD